MGRGMTSSTYLFVEAQIVDDDDAAFDGGEDDGPVNLCCVGGTSYKSSSEFVHSHELGCTSAILIRKCHSMCFVAWSADVWSFFAWQVLV
jgi:hypothetical protein